MKRLLFVAAVLLLLPATCSFASFFDNFDSYAPGQVLDGTADDGGWKGWDNYAGAAGYVTNNAWLSAPNSVMISANSDLVHEYNVTSGIFSFSAMQYIPTGTTGVTYFILLNTYVDYGAKSWSTQLTFNMDTGMIGDDNASGASAAIVRDAWTEVRVDVDLAADVQKIYYNGLHIGTNAWAQGGALAFGAVDLFGNGAGNVFYDDVKLQMVPEPSSLVALVGFLPALTLIRRRK